MMKGVQIKALFHKIEWIWRQQDQYMSGWLQRREVIVKEGTQEVKAEKAYGKGLQKEKGTLPLSHYISNLL